MSKSCLLFYYYYYYYYHYYYIDENNITYNKKNNNKKEEEEEEKEGITNWRENRMEGMEEQITRKRGGEKGEAGLWEGKRR